MRNDRQGDTADASRWTAESAMGGCRVIRMRRVPGRNVARLAGRGRFVGAGRSFVPARHIARPARRTMPSLHIPVAGAGR